MRTATFFCWLVCFVLFNLFSALSVSAGEISSSRNPGEDWTVALARQDRLLAPAMASRWAQPSGATALRMARTWGQGVSLESLPSWGGSLQDLQWAFERMRDEKFYVHSSRPDFLRRSTWLYPNDGCFARAVHAARSFSRMSFPRPGKIFAFGNLRVKTKYDPRGAAHWWFHVAAAFRFGETAWVLDPSVDPIRPRTLPDWLSLISKQPFQVRVTACDTFAYLPRHLCVGGSERQERGFHRHQGLFLPKEWNRLRALRMNPEHLLADDQLWLQEQRQRPIVIPGKIPGFVFD
jgi:hypothetical protein